MDYATKEEWAEALTFNGRLAALLTGFRQKDYQTSVVFPGEHIDAPVIVMVGDYPLDKLGPMPEYAIAAAEWLVGTGRLERQDSLFAGYTERQWQYIMSQPRWWQGGRHN